MEIIVLSNCMLQLYSTTISAARMRIKFHCISCLYVYGNNVILSYLSVSRRYLGLLSNIAGVGYFELYTIII